MRIITTSSRYPYYFARILGLVLLSIPNLALGYTIDDTDGCFVRDTNIVRATEPTCVFTITPDTASESISLTTENIDPDTVTVEMTGDQFTVDHAETVTLTGTLTQSTVVTITPWYEFDDELWFVAISDNQARGTVESNPVFEDMLPMINRINPPFMTNSGDLVQGSSNAETLQDMFAAVLVSLVDSVVPMYPIAGNHDYDPGLATYTSYFGPVDYSFEVGPAKLVALSTSGNTSRGTVTADQLSWLETELASDARNTMLFLHHAVSVPSWGRDTCCYEDTAERDSLAEVIDQSDAELLIAGHSQGYDYRFLTSADVSTIQQGFYQLITGGAGGSISQPDGDFHFTLLHVTADGIEPTPFNLDDTSLVFDETNNNGNKDQATITSEYNGITDLPYLRLKFDLKNYPDASYLVANAAGDYLSFQSHVYDNHRIILATADQQQNTTTDFTATVASTLHLATTNLVDDDGHIQFATQPTDSSSNTNIALTPSKLTATVTELTSTDNGYSWLETPATRSVDSTYTISELTDGDIVSVYLNDELVKRLVVNNNAVEFTLADNARERQISVAIHDGNVLSNIVIAPASDGSAQVRFFTSNGSNLRNFTAYAGTTGGFNLSYGKITDSATDDILLSRPNQRVGLFSQTGTLHDTVGSDDDFHAADVQGNSREELMVEHNGKLRTYRWSQSKEKLVSIDRLGMPHGLQDWMILDGKLITITSNGEYFKLRSYRWRNGWKLRRHKRLPAESTVRIATLNNNLAVVTDSYIHLYNQQLTRLKRKPIPTNRYIQVLAGQLNSKSFETLILLGEDGIIYPYQSRSNQSFKALQSIPANAYMMTAVQFNHSYQSLITTSQTAAPTISVYEYDQTADTWTLRQLLSAYGSGFPGLANLAVQ